CCASDIVHSRLGDPIDLEAFLGRGDQLFPRLLNGRTQYVPLRTHSNHSLFAATVWRSSITCPLMYCCLTARLSALRADTGRDRASLRYMIQFSSQVP